MPHRAGYFVLAYHWDHHCHALNERLKARFGEVLGTLAAVELSDKPSPKALLEAATGLAATRAAVEDHLSRMARRCQVIDELGYRGYGTNRDLAGALRTLQREHREAFEPAFRERFARLTAALPAGTLLPGGTLERLDAGAVATALKARRKGGAKAEAAEPTKEEQARGAFARYFETMSKTPWTVNTTIFQKLFLQMGTGSVTLMRGRVGVESPRPPQELKALANRNFLDMFHESFASLHLFSEIGLDLLKRIHYVLSRDLVAEAGNFRTIDFPDKNGVNTEYANLDREIGDLGKLLRETGQSFHDLPRFFWDLARCYYMFIGIHPFWDSNGRVGRTFLNHMLLKKGVPPLSFREEDEVFALPRYGGTMEEMHEYLTARTLRSMDAYARERSRLEERGLLTREIFNVAFDSGFHFRQLNASPQKLEISCTAYVAPDGSALAQELVEECRVVLPTEALVRTGGLYAGLADSERGEWKKTLGLQVPASIEEIPTDVPGARAFELTFLMDLDESYLRHDWLYVSFISPSDRRVFSNKGIYYGTRIEKRSFGGAIAALAAERWAQPAFKWIGPKKLVRRAPEGEVALHPGGVGFSFLAGGASGLALKVLLEVWRSDGACERYLVDAKPQGGWGGDWQKWETRQLPLLPWDGAHGHVTFVNFGYLVHRDGRAHASQYTYKFANFADFSAESTDRDDFWDPSYKSENAFRPGQVDQAALQQAYDSANARPLDVRVLFTRGAPHSPDHPVREIHRAIDEVIARKKADKKGRHFIHLAIFDFDNEHIANHLVHARQNGVEVECIADWAAVAPVNPTENVARLRRAGIPVLGVVRNTPGAPEEGIGSMHTKFFVFDGEVVHSSSYNLHFHLWGGNREETLVFRSRDVALLYENAFQAIRGGVVQPLQIDPYARLNLYYSFGYQQTKQGKVFRAQDALVTEAQQRQALHRAGDVRPGLPQGRLRRRRLRDRRGHRARQRPRPRREGEDPAQRADRPHRAAAGVLGQGLQAAAQGCCAAAQGRVDGRGLRLLPREHLLALAPQVRVHRRPDLHHRQLQLVRGLGHLRRGAARLARRGARALALRRDPADRVHAAHRAGLRRSERCEDAASNGSAGRSVAGASSMEDRGQGRRSGPAEQPLHRSSSFAARREPAPGRPLSRRFGQWGIEATLTGLLGV
ncbi:MAG: phospholipase D-like domain-containing protein [Myxococcales bacterium]